MNQNKLVGEKQACLEVAVIRIKDQLHDQGEYVVQINNVSQPIKYTIGLPSF